MTHISDFATTLENVLRQYDEAVADRDSATRSYRQAIDLIENLRAMVFEWDTPPYKAIVPGSEAVVYLARKVLKMIDEGMTIVS